MYLNDFRSIHLDMYSFFLFLYTFNFIYVYILNVMSFIQIYIFKLVHSLNKHSNV